MIISENRPCPCLEKLNDATDIALLHARALGPGRFTLVAERNRMDKTFRRDLSWLVRDQKGLLIASVRFNTVMIGDYRALMLGPLVVNTEFKGQGFGAALLTKSLDHIAKTSAAYVILVGDYAYYKRFGFSVVEKGRIQFRGPVDPSRILIKAAGDLDCDKPEGPVSIID